MSQRYLYKKYSIFLSVIFLGIALRLYNLGKVSFWYDEANIILGAENLSNLFRIDISIAPLYFILVYCWKIFGQSEFILRLLSVIFGIASVTGIYFMGKLFFDAKTALLSSFILAISAFHIFYSQELAVYSLLAFLVLLSIYFLKRALEAGRWSFWLGFAVFNALSILTHYTAILFLFSELVLVLFFWRRYKHLSTRWILSHLLILVFLLPWMRVIIPQLIYAIKFRVGWWIPRPLLQSIGITFKNFSVGYNASRVVYYIASAVYIYLFFLGIYSIKKRTELILLLFTIFIPLLCAFLLFKFGIRIYVDRYFLPGALFYYLIVARGLSRFKNGYALSGALIIITALNGLSLYNYYLNHLPNPYRHHIGVQIKPDFRTAAYYIARNFQKGDTVIHMNLNSVLSLEYYLNSQYCDGLKHFRYFSEEGRRRLWVKSPDALDSFKAGKGLWVKSPDDLDSFKVARFNLHDQLPHCRRFFKYQAVPLEQYHRIWVVEHLSEGSPTKRLVILEWMNRDYKKLDNKEFYGLRIYLYDKDVGKDYPNQDKIG